MNRSAFFGHTGPQKLRRPKGIHPCNNVTQPRRILLILLGGRAGLKLEILVRMGPLSIDLLTRQTPQLMADMCPSAFCCRDPMALSPGRIVSDVLLMSALKFGYPIQIFI